MKIYNVALTAQEVADLYTAESTSPAQLHRPGSRFPFAGNADDVTQFENNGSVGGAQLSVDRFGFGGNAYSFAGADSILVSNSVQYNSPGFRQFLGKTDELPAQGRGISAFLRRLAGTLENLLPGTWKTCFTTNSQEAYPIWTPALWQ